MRPWIHRLGVVIIAVALAGCGTEETDTERSGACGEVSEHVVTVIAKVVDEDSQPIEGAAVEVQDRGWEPGTVLGTGSTDASGEVTLDELDVTSVEDCWGTLLDYYLVAAVADRTGEKQINSSLFNAIDDGGLVADLRASPISVP